MNRRGRSRLKGERFRALGFGVYGLGFRVYRVYDLGFRESCRDLGFTASGVEFRVYDLGFRV